MNGIHLNLIFFVFLYIKQDMQIHPHVAGKTLVYISLTVLVFVFSCFKKKINPFNSILKKDKQNLIFYIFFILKEY